MFTKQSSFFKFASAGSILFLTAACAAPPPVPIVADMYFDKFSAAQSASNGVEFCELEVEDFTPELVAQIRSNPNYERNLSVWLQECPELALAFADFGTATIDGTAAPSPFGGEADSGFVGNIGNGPGGGDNGGGDNGGGDNGGGDNGGGDNGGGDNGGGDNGGGDNGGGDNGGGDNGGGDNGGGDNGGGDNGNGDGKGDNGNGDGKGDNGNGDGKGGNGNSGNTNGNSGNSNGNGSSGSSGNQGNGQGNNGNAEGCACDAPADNGNAFG